MYSNYLDPGCINNVKQGAETVDEVSQSAVVVEEVGDVHGEMGGQLDRLGQLYSHIAARVFSDHKGNGVVGIQVGMTTTLAEVQVFSQARSCVVDISQQNRVNDLIIQTKAD